MRTGVGRRKSVDEFTGRQGLLVIGAIGAVLVVLLLLFWLLGLIPFEVDLVGPV